MYNTKNTDNVLSNVICKISDDKAFFTDYVKSDFLDIHNALVKKSYSKIIQSEYNQKSWFRYFSLVISHFNNMNYKACIENCQHANKILSNNSEINYYNAKIHYDNNNYKKALSILSNYLNNIPENNDYYFNKMISLKIYELIIMLLSKLSEKFQCIDLINWLVKNRLKIRNQFSILCVFLNNMDCTKRINVPSIDNYKLTYSNNEKYMIFNQKIIKFIRSKDNLILNICDSNNENPIEICDVDTSNYVYLNYNNKNILQIQLEKNELKIGKLDMETKEIISFMKHNVKGYWCDFILQTNFIELNSYYCSIVKHKDVIYNLFNLLLIEKKTLRPVLITDFIKIMNNRIHDLLVNDGEIILICEHQDKIVSYTLDEKKLYIDYKLPFNYGESIQLNIENLDIKIVTNPPDIIDNIQLNMYSVSDKSTNLINLDYENNVISTNNYNEYITDFMYRYIDVNIVKITTVTFYNRDTCDELYNALKSKKVNIGDVYEFSKYLVINMCELNNLSSNDISGIINSNTLIINIIDEDEIENPCSKIIENEHINKLFLFNIVKNKDYINFIYEKIIQEDQYEQRSNFIEVDKTNINNACGINKYIKVFLEESKSLDSKYEEDYKKIPYKMELITNLHKKTDNLVLIELLRYIIYNNQNITILYNISISELIVKLNILGDIVKLDKLENVPVQDKYLLLLDSYSTLNELKSCCGSGTMIYVNDDNKILYVR